MITQLIVQLSKHETVGQVAHALSFFPKAAWSKFRSNVEEVELFKFKLKVRQEVQADWQARGEELFRRIADSKHRIIFILDELPWMIDRMARSDAHRQEAVTLLRWLRTIRQAPGNRHVRFLLAGSIGVSNVLNQLGEISAINDFEQLRLEPFSADTAKAFLRELSQADDLSFSPAAIRRVLDLIGTLVPYFLQILFSETAKTSRHERRPVTPRMIEQVYRDKVLGVDCKTYFDHYYGRLREYYGANEEAFIKRLLRTLAVQQSMTRDVCHHLYRTFFEGGDSDAFARIMVNLENDFYLTFDPDSRRYSFACKLLKDWWLRHYGMEAGEAGV